jgi:hypothetical protein
MNLKKSFFIFIICILSFLSLLIPSPKKANADSGLVASCQSGLDTWWWLTDDVKQEVEIRDDQLILDAVSGYMMSHNGQNDTVYAQFIRRDQGVVSTGSGTVTPNPSWVTFTMSPVAIPRGVYYLKFYTNTQNGAIWSYTYNPNCYDGGYVLINGTTHTTDMNFAVYAHRDTGSSSGATTPSTSSGTSGSSSNSGNRSSTGSTSSKNLKSSWTPPTDAEILAMSKDSDSGGLFFPFGGILMLILPAIAFFGFIVIIVVIVIIVSRKKAKPITVNKK